MILNFLVFVAATTEMWRKPSSCADCIYFSQPTVESITQLQPSSHMLVSVQSARESNSRWPTKRPDLPSDYNTPVTVARLSSLSYWYALTSDTSPEHVLKITTSRLTANPLQKVSLNFEDKSPSRISEFVWLADHALTCSAHRAYKNTR